jgi:hypothetical protein
MRPSRDSAKGVYEMGAKNDKFDEFIIRFYHTRVLCGGV